MAENKIVGNVTCPKCRHKQPIEIPKTSCQAFYKCDSCGKVIQAQKSCCVFLVHGRLMKEHRVDQKATAEIKKERNLAIIGIMLIIFGYLFQLPSKII